MKIFAYLVGPLKRYGKAFFTIFISEIPFFAENFDSDLEAVGLFFTKRGV